MINVEVGGQPERRRFARGVAIVGVIFTLAISTPAHVASVEATDAATGVTPDGRSYRQRVIDERSVYGLPVDSGAIDYLITGGGDVGTEEWGSR